MYNANNLLGWACNEKKELFGNFMEGGRSMAVHEHFDDVLAALDEWVDISGRKVREDTLLFEELGVDSVQLLAVFDTLRTNLGIPMPKMKYLQQLDKKVRTVSDLCDYVTNAKRALADQVASF